MRVSCRTGLLCVGQPPRGVCTSMGEMSGFGPPLVGDNDSDQYASL
jgi:hypothetical protein